MKTINYTGSSKIIKRIVQLLNRKVPLPLDGQGDADWGTNGQVLTTDGQGNTSWTTPQGGGGDVTDVEVNGTSVVNAQGVAEVSVPTKTSDLNNDSGFITNLVNDLVNYYTKSQTYTQAEVNALISGIVTLNILVVQTLPTQDISTTTIYLVPKQDTGTSDIYDEYLYINNAWELIGTTQIDLSNYVTTTDLSTALADYVTSVGLATILADYVQSSDLATVATSGSYNDLTNQPTIPTVNNGKLTIQQNGTTVKTFTANQSSNVTANITVPTKTSDLTNDSSFVADNPIFTEAATRANIASGESFATILGKIKKFFTDLATVAFSGSYSDLSGTPDLTNVAYKNVDNSFTSNQTINRNNGTTSAVGSSYIMLGNDIPSGTAKNSRGVIRLFGSGDKYAQIYDNGALTANRNLNLPDKSGTIALTSDIPTVPKIVFYGTCTGQAANQTKAVVVDSSQSFALTAGIILLVKFDANNTYSATAEAPVKLDVNSTGAKNIYYAGSNAPTGTNTTAFGRTNYVNQYYYDGTNWVWAGSSADNNTTYSNMSASELTTGTATTARSISAKVLNDWNTAANTTYSNTTSGLSATKVQGAIDEVAEEVVQTYEANGILGAKNLIPYPYYATESTVNNGITYTLNAEGNIVANGTATANSSFYLAVRSGSSAIPLKAGTYILSGCPNGGASTTYSLHLNSYLVGTTTNSTGIYNVGGDTKGTFAQDVVCGIYIDIRKNTTVNNLTFKPMLRLGSDTDDTWHPYAMTNKALMDAIEDLDADVNGTYNSSTKSIADLDSMTNTGRYYFIMNETGGIFGNGWTYFMEVFRTIYQGATWGYVQRISLVYPPRGQTWQRSYYVAGGWSEWRELSNATDVGKACVAGISSTSDITVTTTAMSVPFDTARVNDDSNLYEVASNNIYVKKTGIYQVTATIHYVAHPGDYFYMTLYDSTNKLWAGDKMHFDSDEARLCTINQVLVATQATRVYVTCVSALGNAIIYGTTAGGASVQLLQVVKIG